MKEQESPHTGDTSHVNTQERTPEQGDVAEPDAPTSGEENEGMNTILSGEPLTGVQKDAGDE